MRVLLAVVCGAMALVVYASSRSSQPQTGSQPTSPPPTRIGRLPVPLPTHFNRLSSYYRVHLN